MRRLPPLALTLPPLVLAGPLPASPSGPAEPFVFDAVAAEHLLNRAGFGAAPEEVLAAVELGREAVVDRLLAGAAGPGRPLLEARPKLRPDLPVPGTFEDDALEPGVVRHEWPEYLGEMGAYLESWIASMLAGDDPLRDKMALFWHNHFVSGFLEVKDPGAMVAQATFLRAHALDRFDVLVRGIARDPAMLVYLDNESNVKAHPNENWARELMELFVLGEGHYSEHDVQEAARAFTGWTHADRRFLVDPMQHDYAAKSVLGVTGNLDGDLVIDVLLAREDCSEWLAFKLLGDFEGRPPEPERLRDYAAFLREHDLDVAAFLRRLFLDDAFYRPEIVGTRVSGPIEHLVGTARRLGADVPPQMVFAAGDLLGQRLFCPPSVQGWQGGLAWLGTAAVLNRANVAAGILGRADLLRLRLGGDGDRERGPVRSLGLAPHDPMLTLGVIQENGWLPRLDLASGLTGDVGADAAALARRLLGVPVTGETAAALGAVLEGERERAGLAPGAGYASPEGEEALRSAAYAVLSLPEAVMQ